jgi:hypothetical protein
MGKVSRRGLKNVPLGAGPLQGNCAQIFGETVLELLDNLLIVLTVLTGTCILPARQ